MGFNFRRGAADPRGGRVEWRGELACKRAARGAEIVSCYALGAAPAILWPTREKIDGLRVHASGDLSLQFWCPVGAAENKIEIAPYKN